MKAFILLSIIAATFASQQCGENEHFESCGTACPLTCENYRDPPRICFLSCNIGCHCDEGYVRASDGRCVKPEQCPSQAVNQQCGENEHFEDCGTACPLTCENYRDPPRFCVLSCNIGCHCDEGYVRATDGRCVKPDQCPSQAVNQQCGENEHFESCGTACPLTCENYDDPPRFCVKRCDIGCHCDTGYVRTSDGRCVKPDQCPSLAEPVCGENQHYNVCGTACPLTCDNYANPPKICVKMCAIGCQCEKGYVMNRDGRCVRPENCPSRPPPTVKTCTEKPETGMCMAYFPSWYYDTETGACKEFVYGGCGGNGNRYGSEKECLENCKAKAAPTACLEEKMTGPCKAYFIRWFFNKETEQCEEFVYGGCNANSNNFLSKEDCHAVCAE